MQLKKVLLTAVILELATGLALILVPSLVIRLLLGENPAGGIVPVAQFLGAALTGLAVACWRTPALGMLLYNALATLALAIPGVRGDWNGPLLLPGAIIHLGLTLVLAFLIKGEKAIR